MTATPRPYARLAAGVLVGCALLGPVVSAAPAAADHGSDDPGIDDSGSSAASTSGSRGSGGDDDRVELRGSCSGRAEWKVKVRSDDGRLEVEAEVDSGRTGQGWRWKLRHNGSVTARGRGWTSGPSGSFDVERTIVDLTGTDDVSFRATYAGQVCRGVVHY